MKVSLLLFASLRDAIGERTLCMEFDEGSTVADLKRRLGAEYPRVERMLETVVCAIDDDYVTFEEALHDGAEVALIPPVSGGAVETSPAFFRLTHDVMNPQALVELVQRDEAGAVALFYGNVRNHSEGRDVERLEYEAHETMAVAKMREVAEETKRRFPEVSEVGVWHRVGMLEVGETSLLVAVSSPHRKEAFDACHWCVDRVKQVVPVWKKEHWVGGGAEWVPGYQIDVT
ncbi:MAG TPA: molybdenum cofactor biosynthesis protein MoaE [Dehalococcoidia bacterium]|nr:molybdenum cofactor biosynthesis protein MoaE [Dehalococcoidia bacterium]